VYVRVLGDAPALSGEAMTYEEAIHSTGPITEEAVEAVKEEFVRTLKGLPESSFELKGDAAALPPGIPLSRLIKVEIVRSAEDGDPVQSRFVDTPDGQSVQVKVGEEWNP